MQNEDTGTQQFDVQYSVQLSEDMLTEITVRAAQEGIKPSAWIRNCIAAALAQTSDTAVTAPAQPAEPEAVPAAEPAEEDTMADEKKAEEKPDKVRASLLSLLKRDKHVRDMIRDISAESLPETDALKQKCDTLAAAVLEIHSKLEESRHALAELYAKRQDYDTRIKSATNEIGVLKHISHGTDKSAGDKELMEKCLKEIETLNIERSKVSAEIPRLELALHDDENKEYDLRREYDITRQKLEILLRKE